MFPDPPTPSLLLESGWLDVLPSERAEFRCSIPGSSDWTLIWYKDGQELSETDSVISAAEGSYVCKGRHKTQDVTTPDSKPLQLRVHGKFMSHPSYCLMYKEWNNSIFHFPVWLASKPKSTVTQTPKHDPMYIGETVTLRCGVNVSSGWEYVWFRNGNELGAKGNYTLNSPNQLDGGQYTCRAQRGESPVFTEESEPVTLQFSGTHQNLPSRPCYQLGHTAAHDTLYALLCRWSRTPLCTWFMPFTVWIANDAHSAYWLFHELVNLQATKFLNSQNGTESLQSRGIWY